MDRVLGIVSAGLSRASTPVWVVAVGVSLAVAAGCSKDKSPKTQASASEKLEKQAEPELPKEPSAADSDHSAGAAKPTEQPNTGDGPHPGLLDPAQATGRAPEEFSVRFETTKGEFIVDVKRAWAPIGADRFYNLVRIGYFDDTAFFRVVENFMAQVGIHGDPAVNAAWRTASIKDDPVTQSNLRGFVSFATSGRDSRVNQFFINFTDNSRLDRLQPAGFAPFGKVRDMAVVDQLHSGYGEGAPAGQGPMQRLVQFRGNEYLRAEFPKLDYIKSATLID